MTIELDVWQIVSVAASVIAAAFAFYVDSAKKFAKIQTEMHEVKQQNKLLFAKNDKILEALTEMKVQIAKIDNHEKR
jgi:uncharacterized membrane protein (DUF106 family)